MIVDYLGYGGALRELYDLSRLEVRFATGKDDPVILPGSALQANGVPNEAKLGDHIFGVMKGDACDLDLQEVRLVFNPRHVFTGALRLPKAYEIIRDLDEWDEWFGWAVQLTLYVQAHREGGIEILVHKRQGSAVSELRICLDPLPPPGEEAPLSTQGSLWDLLRKRRR